MHHYRLLVASIVCGASMFDVVHSFASWFEDFQDSYPYMAIDYNSTDLSSVMTCADASVTDAACGSGFEVNPDSRELRQLTFEPGPEFPALCEGSSFETRVADAPYDACLNETFTVFDCEALTDEASERDDKRVSAFTTTS